MQVQTWIFPCGEQWLHSLGNVCYWWKCKPHHQQPGQQISCTSQSFCKRGITTLASHIDETIKFDFSMPFTYLIVLFVDDKFCLGQVTKRVDTPSGQWKGWNWRSEGDLLLNGAYFTPSGAGASASYARASSLGAKSSSMVGSITSNAGALSCRRGSQC